MSNQVVTIGYLKDFVNGKLTVSTNMPDTYCPTYGELTGGELVFNYSSASNPKDTVNGIDIPKCTVDTGYTSNQLVIRQDLLLKYMVLDGISIKADSNDIDKCGGSTNICVTGTFHLVTKSEDGETDGNTETDTTIPVAWSGDADNSGPSTCTVISFGLNAVGNPGTENPTSAPSRDKSTTATYIYKGINLTDDNETTKTSNTVTVTQGANNVGEWYYVPSEDYATSLVADCPGIISELGGTATVTSTLYYKQRWKADDSCENVVGLKYIDASKTGPTEYHTFEEQDCDADEVTVTVTVSESGQTDSCNVTQEASSVPCFCGNGCPDASCNGEVHWGCAMKKGETEYEYYCDTAEVNGLDEKKYLPAAGGTATVTIKGKSKKGIWTRSAICGNESLPAQIVDSLPSLPAVESSQNTVYLLLDKKGATGGSLSYTDSNGNTQYTYSYTYTSYTQYHYTVWLEDVTVGKKTIKEERWGWISGGRSYIREANSVTTYGYDYVPYYSYEKDLYLANGNSESSWDAAYDPWYEKWVKYNASERFFCDGVEVGSEEEMLNCEGEQERRLDESLNPGTFVIYGNYWTSWTKYGESGTSEMSRVTKCCVRNISTEYNKLVEHLSNLTDIETTLSFSYDANDTDTPKPGTATVTLPNGKTCSVSYIVGNGKSKFELSTTNATVEAAAAEAYVTVSSKKDNKPYPTFTFSESCDWVSNLTINNPESTTGSYSVQATLVPNTSAERNCNITVTQSGGKTDTFTITQKGKEETGHNVCMDAVITNNNNCSGEIIFKNSVGDEVTTCSVTDGAATVCYDKDKTIYISMRDNDGTSCQIQGGGTSFTVIEGGTVSIIVSCSGGGGEPSEPEVCVTSNTWNSISASVSADACDTEPTVSVTANGTHTNNDCSSTPTSTTVFDYTIKYSKTNGNYTLSKIEQNTGSSSKTWYYSVTGGTAYGSKTTTGSFIQSGGCSTGSPTCSTSNTWNSISASVSASECTTSPTVSVTASGTHTFADCSTSGTSTTVSDYTIKYGTTRGSYTLDNITQNTGSSSKTWYYKVTASSTYGSKTTTGSFTQAGGCKEYTGSTTEYEMKVVDTTVDKCATTAPSITVQGRSYTVSGYSDGSKTSGTPTSWVSLTNNTHYTLDVPTISQNTGSTSKSYTVTATGKGTYAGESATGKITQAGGCVVGPSYTGETTEYEMKVVDTTVDKCATTAPSITVQGRSYTVSGYSDGSKTSGTPTSWASITKGTDYTLDVPTISQNTGSTSKSYTVTATGKGKYAGESATGKITQAGGCVNVTYTCNGVSVNNFSLTSGGTTVTGYVTSYATSSNSTIVGVPVTVSSKPSWATVTIDSSFNSSNKGYKISVSASSNLDAARSGTLRISQSSNSYGCSGSDSSTISQDSGLVAMDIVITNDDDRQATLDFYYSDGTLVTSCEARTSAWTFYGKKGYSVQVHCSEPALNLSTTAFTVVEGGTVYIEITLF